MVVIIGFSRGSPVAFLTTWLLNAFRFLRPLDGLGLFYIPKDPSINPEEAITIPDEFFEVEDCPLDSWLCEGVVVLNPVQQLAQAPVAICFHLQSAVAFKFWVTDKGKHYRLDSIKYGAQAPVAVRFHLQGFQRARVGNIMRLRMGFEARSEGFEAGPHAYRGTRNY